MNIYHHGDRITITVTIDAELETDLPELSHKIVEDWVVGELDEKMPGVIINMDSFILFKTFTYEIVRQGDKDADRH